MNIKIGDMLGNINLEDHVQEITEEKAAEAAEEPVTEPVKSEEEQEKIDGGQPEAAGETEAPVIETSEAAADADELVAEQGTGADVDEAIIEVPEPVVDAEEPVTDPVKAEEE